MFKKSAIDPYLLYMTDIRRYIKRQVKPHTHFIIIIYESAKCIVFNNSESQIRQGRMTNVAYESATLILLNSPDAHNTHS